MLGELRRWKRRAASYGLTLSQLVRAVLNGDAVRTVSVADPTVLHELRRHGNNLNQLMHAINAGFPVAPERVEKAVFALHALYLREIERG